MKKILLLVLISVLALLALTSCDILGEIIPGVKPTPDDNVTVDFDSSKVQFPDRIFTYDGKEKTLTIASTLPSGITVQYEGNVKTDAGVYSVTAKFYQDGVYIEGEDLTAKLTIKAAHYDMTSFVLESKTFEYNGDTFVPAYTGTLPEGVTVELVYDAPIRDAGVYQVTAKFNGDANHVHIPDMKVTYTVAPASYDMSGISFDHVNVEYDGKVHSLTISGTLPEGVTVEYVNNGHTEIGEYEVTAVFTSADPNYRAPDAMVAFLYITPEVMRPVELVYNLKDDGTYEVVGYVGDNPHVIIPATYKNKRVTSVKSGAFEDNVNITFLNVPVTVTNIGNKAFKGCTSLSSLSLRGALTVIGYQAFANTAITEIALPDTLVSIGQGALMGTPIESLTLPFVGGSKGSANTYLGFLFGATSYSGNAATVPETLKTVILSDAAERIPAFAFYGVSSLAEVVIGKNVSFIGNSAFFGTSLSSLYVPKSVTDVPADAGAENSPFYGLPADTVIMLESIAGEGFGRYWNAVSDTKYAITVYLKSYDYYLENKETMKNADMTVATLDGITVDKSLLDGFSSDILEYTANADINEGYPLVSAISTSPIALITVEQASASNGGVATITVVSADMTSTAVYKVSFIVTGTFKPGAEVVGKDGTTGTVTFVVDDGDHATAEFTAEMMDKYDELKFTYALITNRLATLNTVYDPTTGKYKYVMDGDGKYTYTVKQTEVDFWNNLLINYDTEVISHTHTHAFWGNDDNGGVQQYVDSSGNVKTSSNLPIGSASADIFASLQIIEDLFGIRALTHTEPGIGAKTADTTVNGVTYETYRTYYKELVDDALLDGTIVNYIGGVMGLTSANIDKYVTKENIKNPNGVARLMVTPSDNKDLWNQFIDNAAGNNGWATFCIHKITPAASSGHYILESDAENLFAHAASKNVWIANYTEAALYYAEWASARVTTAYEDGAIKITLTDSEDNTVYDEKLTVKVYVPTVWGSVSMNGETLTVHTDEYGSFVYANILPDSGVQEIIGA